MSPHVTQPTAYITRISACIGPMNTYKDVVATRCDNFSGTPSADGYNTIRIMQPKLDNKQVCHGPDQAATLGADGFEPGYPL